MASLNKVTLIGNLGKDPELRYTQAQMPFAKFSLATTETFKSANGEKKDKTQWHNIVIWGKLAEIAQKYLHKGKQVYLEGSIEYSEYDDNTGNKRYRTEIKVSEMIMLGSAGQGAGSYGAPAGAASGGGYGGGGGGFNQGAPSYGGGMPEPQNYGGPMNAPESDDFNDDDIPF